MRVSCKTHAFKSFFLLGDGRSNISVFRPSDVLSTSLLTQMAR
jgi:hypothetical protein